MSDKSGFWEQRDLELLARSVGEWNAMVAGVAGRLKDEFGSSIIAPISGFPNFEHLEAQGRAAEEG